MTDPIVKPKRKNPLVRTRVPLLPPSARSRTAHGFTLAAAEGRFVMQRCRECRQFVYPARDACPNCLSHRLGFDEVPNGGQLVALTTVHISNDPYFRERTPWRAGIVALDCGPRVLAHLHGDCVESGRVRVSLQLDRSGQAVIVALPNSETPDMRDDRAWREMTADPKFRRVLVTDGRNPVGQAMARALVTANAAKVFVGIADPWKPFPGEASLHGLEGVEIVPLDATDEESVAGLASDIGARVDILINTADYTRPVSLFEAAGARKLFETMDATLLGATRLAGAFGPIMLSRGADGTNSAAAWVNILSIYALENLPAYGALSVSHAACLSLSHWLRAELRAGSVKVMNAFTGPQDTEWYQAVPPPKVSPTTLADGVIDGLRRGLEEIYVGDVAQQIYQRQRANPKALEREISE